MKQTAENVPAIVTDIARNLFDHNNRRGIRENYKRTLLAIKTYCDMALSEYDKQRNQESNKKSA
jgi:hypothetical protein